MMGAGVVKSKNSFPGCVSASLPLIEAGQKFFGLATTPALWPPLLARRESSFCH